MLYVVVVACIALHVPVEIRATESNEKDRYGS